MSLSKKAKKRVIVLSCVLVALAAVVLSVWLYISYKNDQKTVEVLPVMQISDTYWGDQTYSSGTVVSDHVQEIHVSSEKSVSEVFVEEGQEVKIGDALLRYDTTRLELDQQAKELAVQTIELQLSSAQKQLKKLQNTKPSASPAPTQKPTPTPSSRPTAGPTAGPTSQPTPTPVPTADVTLYSRLDLDAGPYRGSGTTDDPYVFLCTDDCVMTGDFLKWLLGMDVELEATPTPAPTSAPTPVPPESSEESSPEDEGSPEGSESAVTSPTPPPTPTPEPTPVPPSKLASPFAAVFEVRDGNSNHGSLISAFKLDGTQFTANFQIKDLITGTNTLGSVADRFGAPTPSPEPDNYNHMGYSSTELNRLITEKKQEIEKLQIERKQADLNLRKANLQMSNSTVLSSIDGTVVSILDEDTARMTGDPLLVVSGEEKVYISGVLSENLLGIVNVGDTITVNSYQREMITCTAEIVSISDYPLEADSGYYSYGPGNPNSSNYGFTAVAEEGVALQNGWYVDIVIDLRSQDGENVFYMDKAYIRSDKRGSYVMKAGIDDRLIRQYVQTGKSIYGGNYVEIISGLTREDYVAFPYGPDVKEGVRTRMQGSEDGPHNGAGGGTVITEVPVDEDDGLAITVGEDSTPEDLPESAPEDLPDSAPEGLSDALPEEFPVEIPDEGGESPDA